MTSVGDVLIAPLTPINPWFYWGLYESTQDDTTSEYVGDHLVAMSGWIFASTVHAATTGQVISPFKAMTDGLQIMRYVALDYGAGAFFSNPVVLATAGSALGTVYVGSKLMAPDSPEKYSKPWYHFMQAIGENIRISAP